ncbi:MAG: hypothetical protein FJZ00_09850 [Candidatus Sericytochromatia bacterium]|uniref:Lipoprotein n=1 Tax=Candidatus Tanganyikabacteria bacterium TaxID=2961651 RepID=A0A938BJL3_9BACT|nr:hypothetical protein [Candidatus Tanganyikabacteria bacterium]
MANRGRLLAAIALGVALLTGCGEDPTGNRATAGTQTSTGYTSGTSYPSTPAYSTPASPAGNVYGTVPTTNPTTGCNQVTAGATQGVTTAQTGCGQAGNPGALNPGTGKKGLEAKITDRKESGIFSKSLKSITVELANHDATAQSRFLLIVFKKKGKEVEVQYKSVNMSPGGSTTLTFAATKDADDATVELRDTLL